ncbi:hypothetical protein [Embleya sp. NBC_00896]|uniref:hypothetical protein n=1 Tax=Embleya sp. NBC_00896 TaxID=2975961 RepID=UPI002F90E95D|nr:hypothetical protein OG928_48120 [Embleya sp. NBC_00896]
MTRPLTQLELGQDFRQNWYIEQEKKARGSRGELGAMEFWLRITRAEIAREVRAHRSDVLPGFALVLRLFLAAIHKRRTGDPRIWNDLLKYARAVVDPDPGPDARRD